MSIKLLTSTGDRCLLFSFAMLLDIPPDRLMEEIGHNGLEQVKFGNVVSRRNFHIQEFIDYGLDHGIAIVQWGTDPLIGNDVNGPFISAYAPEQQNELLTKYLDNYDCVITTNTHACVWDHERKLVLDPKGYLGKLEDYEINYLFFAFKLGIKSDSSV